jgi:ketosteroid isomerase-like protein
VTSPAQLAQRFVDAVTVRDLDALRQLLDDDAVFWTNATLTDTRKDARLTQIAIEFRTFDRFAFEDVRIDDFDSGFVLRACARGALPGGAQFEFPICIVADTHDGHIRRLEEYFDPAAVKPILNALAATAR